MIKIHQRQEGAFEPEFDGVFSSYHHVANVDTDSLDEVFLFSNHPLREDYGYDEAFDYLGDVPARSVSVSDILETEDGKFFYVAPVGFEEINEWKAL